MTKIKASESDLDSNSEPNVIAADHGKHIIDVKLSVNVDTTQIQPEDLEDLEPEVI